MSYQIQHDPENKVICVSYAGTASLSERMAAVEDVCTQHASLTPFKILVDVVDLVMDLPVEEQIQFGEYISSHQMLNDARVAVIHQTDNNPNQVIDTVAFSNGYTLAEFTSKKQAIEWLLEG